MLSTMRTMHYTKLQCILQLTTGKLQIAQHKIAIVLHYTTLHPFLTPTVHTSLVSRVKLPSLLCVP